MKDRNEWFEEVERAWRKLKIVERPYAAPYPALAVEAEDVLCALGLHAHERRERAVTFNDVEFKACPRCGVEPAIKDVRVRSLTEPNVMSVTCPACGMSNSIAWGSMGQASLEHAVAMLADSWNSR